MVVIGMVGMVIGVALAHTADRLSSRSISYERLGGALLAAGLALAAAALPMI